MPHAIFQPIRKRPAKTNKSFIYSQRWNGWAIYSSWTTGTIYFSMFNQITQDRVIQVYEGLVYMDFDKALFEKQGHGDYLPLNVSKY